jgi:hypothetical protein
VLEVEMLALGMLALGMLALGMLALGMLGMGMLAAWWPPKSKSVEKVISGERFPWNG